MSDYLKKLKNIFIVEDATTPQAEQPPVKERVTPPASSNAPTAAPIRASAAGTVNDRFMDVLAEALQNNNIDGVDYFEFRQSLLSLSKISMDEKTRYQSAFAMAQAMGATPKQLIETAEHYLNVLKNEEHKFAQAIANQQENNIRNREADIQTLAQAIETKNKQIAQLQQEIKQHQAQMQHRILSLCKNHSGNAPKALRVFSF